MNSAAEVAGAMAAAGCSPEQIAATLTKLEGLKSAQLRRERNQRYYQSRVLKRLDPASEPVLEPSEIRLNSSESRAPTRVHDLALSLEERKKEVPTEPRTKESSNGHSVDLDLFAKPPSKPKRDTSQADAIVDGFLDRWRALAAQTGLADWRAVTDSRRGKILARAKDLVDVLGYATWAAGFDEVMARIRGSPQLLGQMGDRNWKCDIDWVINETNLLKIMEGRYAKIANKVGQFGGAQHAYGR